MSYQQIKLTEQGKELIQRAVTDGSPVEFSQARLSSHKYTDEELEKLKVLDNVQQTAELRDSKRLDENTVQVSTSFNNEGSGGFTIHTIGIYALNPDYIEPEPVEDVVTEEETLQEEPPVEAETPEENEDGEPAEEVVQEKHLLYGVAVASDNPFYMSPSTKNPTTLNLRLTVGVGEAEVVNLHVNPQDSVTHKELSDLEATLHQVEEETQVSQALALNELIQAMNYLKELNDISQAQAYTEILSLITAFNKEETDDI